MTTINIENFKKARQWVADEPYFDMRTYGLMAKLGEMDGALALLDKNPLTGHACDFMSMIGSGADVPDDCGTIQCLAGTITLKTRSPGQVVDNLETFAAQFLGLNEFESSTMFLTAFYYGQDLLALQDVTKEMVIARLDEIIEAGEFIWPDYYRDD